MKYSFAAFLGAGIFLGICDAACFITKTFEPNEKDPGGCKHEGTFYRYGSSWSKNCIDCECSQGSLRCCVRGSQPVKYDTEMCTAIFDKDNCKYRYVRKDDPRRTCPHEIIG
ncbi:hypothetical protein GDO81_004358 [Engystomops pustulosus]|uniref:Beta-microseminoprotein n=1 Tax=Engystomops pustulosus TaxID=76066 RepID=A0AAV6ZRL1_ENGPU|nr:hypothetical protein GDO81_004358 [Engystomops pustulosus]